MQLLVWNINGCSEVARALWDTCEYLSQFSIVALTETQRPEFAPSLLQGYVHFAVHAPVGGRRGHGLAIYVRDDIASGVSIWKHDVELSILWLKFPGASFGVDRSVFLGLVYLPPQGSHRLQLQPMDQRYVELAAHVGHAQDNGHVLLCGDFNAHVSDTGDVGLAASGCSLLSFCEACNLELVTGKLLGDCPAKPSFAARAHTGPSRPDHVVVSHALLPKLSSLHVHSDRNDSDHYPMHLCLNVCEVAQSMAASGEVGSCARLRWDRRHLDAYQEGLLDDACISNLRSVIHSLDVGNGADAARSMKHVLLSTAKAVGMRAGRACLSSNRRVLSRQKPWFDSECRELKCAVKAARAAGAAVNSAELQQARAAFKKVARRKRRRFRSLCLC